MGLWDRFKKAKTPPAPPDPGPRQTGRYLDLLSARVGQALFQQQLFGELVVQNRDWNVDFEAGRISFGGDRFPIQFLGTEATEAATWLWGFANPSGFAPEVYHEVKEIHARCLREGCSELEEAELPLSDTLNGHCLAMLFSDLYPEQVCYYRCPYEGGAAFVLVKDLPAAVFSKATARQLIDTVRHCVNNFNLDHQAMVRGLLLAQGCVLTEEEEQWRAVHGDGSVLEFGFDRLGRLSGISAELGGK